jgi:tetratricopeptide (TPR) repeat protein
MSRFAQGRRAFGAWVSLVACLQTVALTTTVSVPVYAQPQKPAAKPAQPQDLIAKGQSQFEDQQYEESIQTLSAALLRPSNTPQQKVEIYRLLALNYITIGRKDEAESAVRGLLVQNPDYALPASESPRFRDFFAAAKAKWEQEGRPGLQKDEPTQKPVVMKHNTPAEVDAEKTVELRGRLDDPEGRAGTVKLYYRSGSKGDFTEAVATLDGGAVRASIPAEAVKPPLVDYYFEVLDGAGGVIASRGDASAPLRIAVPEPSKGWVLPVAIGGAVLGAAAIIGILAAAGAFSSSTTPNPGGGGKSTVSVNIGEASYGSVFTFR